MSVIKCKMCGAPLRIEPGLQIVTCHACDVSQTIPNANDELKLQMFERAYESRYRCDFMGAASTFQGIVTLFPDEAEAYWGLCLCNYGVEYVDDPATLRKKPTCHRTLLKSILADHNYLKACETAGVAKWKYEEEAKEIDAIQNKIRSLASNEKPYDIFICYKETDESSGARTDDSYTAQDIYTALVENGYRVFFARNTLKGKAGSEYEPYIYAALSTAKVMLVIGSKPEYYEAVWVKNEWSRFMSIGESTNKTIIPCFENMDAYQLPPELRSYQGLDMRNTMFSVDLMNNIKRIIPKNNSDNFKSSANTSDTKSAIKELDMKDGVYVGEAIASRPHGLGTYMYNNGTKYEGCWVMGEKTGKGTYTYANGESWNGEWYKNNPINGSGVYYDTVSNNQRRCQSGTMKDGKLYGNGSITIGGKPYQEGIFENGLLNGKGTAYTNGIKCAGEFKNGTPWNADGYFPVSKTNYCFNGVWKNGLPNGKGSYTVTFSKNRSANVTGTFKDGLNGETTWTFSDGCKFVGTVQNGNPAKGVYTTAKERYEGEIQNYRYHGKGTLYRGNDRYEGDFRNGNFNGRGTYYYPEGKWTGLWKDNVQWDGQGLIFYHENGKRNGICYNGQIRNGFCHGQGTMFYQQGGKWTGLWKEGKRWNGTGLVPHVDDKGKPNGDYYNGAIINGVANGMGVLYCAKNGSRIEGEFKNDRIYNGTVYDAQSKVLDTYSNGVSRNLKRQRNAQTALDILSKL